MKCKHGIMGPCAQCNGELRSWKRETLSVKLLAEIGQLVLELASVHRLDTEKLETLLKELE